VIASQLSDTLWAVVVGALLTGVIGVGGSWLSDRWRRSEAREVRAAAQADRLRDRRERDLIELQEAAKAFIDAVTTATANKIAKGEVQPDDASRVQLAHLAMVNPAARLDDEKLQRVLDQNGHLAKRVLEGGMTADDLEEIEIPLDQLQRRLGEMFRELDQ